MNGNEIRRVRLMLGMTQSGFGRLVLGGPEKAGRPDPRQVQVARWEAGQRGKTMKQFNFFRGHRGKLEIATASADGGNSIAVIDEDGGVDITCDGLSLHLDDARVLEILREAIAETDQSRAFGGDGWPRGALAAVA